MNHYECGNLFGASKSLLEGSGLVRNCGDSFACNSDQEGLERWWSGSFDAEFGRYMAWVWFSVGAENLVKATLVCNGLLEEEKENPDYPIYWRDTERELGRRGAAMPGKCGGRVWILGEDFGRQARQVVPKAWDPRDRRQGSEGSLQVPGASDQKPGCSLIQEEPAQKGLSGG